jgi:hypothetical protein
MFFQNFPGYTVIETMFFNHINKIKVNCNKIVQNITFIKI